VRDVFGSYKREDDAGLGRRAPALENAWAASPLTNEASGWSVCGGTSLIGETPLAINSDVSGKNVAVYVTLELRSRICE
jgi:hypothetical protein